MGDKQYGIWRRVSDYTDPLHWYVLCAVIACGLFVRAYSFQGFSGSDPYAYTVLAHDLSNGILHIPDYDGPPVFPLRTGVYFPVALLFKVFGLSEITIVAFPFFISIMAMIFGYGFGRLLFSPAGGLFVVFFLAALPIDHMLSSLLLPDLIGAFWGNLGMFFTYLALSESKGKRRTIIMGMLGGLFFGMSWLCKETVLYLVPLVALLGLFPIVTKDVHTRITAMLSIGVTAVSVMVAEGLFLFVRSGDILYRFYEIERNYEVCKVFFFPNYSTYNGWKNDSYTVLLLYRLFINGPRQLVLCGNFSGIPVLACYASLVAFVYKKKQFLFSGLWFIYLLLIFNFGSSSLSSYLPLPIVHRYLYPLLFPACLMAGGWAAYSIASLLDGEDAPVRVRAVHYLYMLLFAGAISVSAYEVVKYGADRAEYPERITADLVSQDDLVYSDYITVISLSFLRNNQLTQVDNTKPYERMNVDSFPNGCYVFVDKERTYFLQEKYSYERMAFEDDPPENWDVVLKEKGAVLYRVK